MRTEAEVQKVLAVFIDYVESSPVPSIPTQAALGAITACLQWVLGSNDADNPMVYAVGQLHIKGRKF